MTTPGSRRLRPLAVLCALLMVAWGVVSAVALVEQIVELNDVGWPDETADGEVFGWIWLYLLAASSGCWVAVWGLFGLGWRPPLHFALVAVLVAVGFEVAANLVQAGYIADQVDRGWSFGDQLRWYGDRVTFNADGLSGDRETRGFLIALPLVTAVVPVVAWLVVMVTGAGRKERFAPAYGGPAYPQPQPYYPQQQPYYPQPQPYYGHPAQQQPNYQPPAYQPPPPPQPRTPWQQVPPVVPPARPTPPRYDPPEQKETLRYPGPSDGS